MSKSEGNIFLLHEALDEYGPEAVVDFLISGHYRQPLAFGEDALEEARARNQRIRDFFREAEREDGEPDPVVAEIREAFLTALADDFNTPRAMAAVYDLVTEGHKRAPLRGAHRVMEELLEIVGLESLAGVDEADPHAERLLAERDAARAARDYERADGLRDELAELGYDVRDGPDGGRLVRRA
jgi:cysteinyl-tRNA synthetase